MSAPTFDLTKGQTFDLTKAAPAVNDFYVGLGWKEGPYDLDLNIFPCIIDSNGDSRLISPPYFIFYNQTKSPCGGIVRSADNLTGKDGTGPNGIATSDDEWAQIRLNLLDPQIRELAFIVTIHEAAQRNHNFGQVGDAYISIYEMDSKGEPVGQPLTRYRLDEDASDSYAVQFGSLMKQPDGSWQFQAVGAGFKADLATIIKQYMPEAVV